jgi:ketosteroid isomerase-like protein
MAEDNVEIVRRSTEAAARGDLDTAVSDLAHDVEVEDTDIPDAGDYRGHEGYFQWLEQWGESWESYEIHGLEFRPAPDGRVVALFDIVATGKGSGIELTRGDAIVSTVRDGKISRIVYYNDQQRALTEAALA